MDDWDIEELLKEIINEWDAGNTDRASEAKKQFEEDYAKSKKKKRGGTVSRKRGNKIMQGYKAGGKV